jgi:hypothetical protein
LTHVNGIHETQAAKGVYGANRICYLSPVARRLRLRAQRIAAPDALRVTYKITMEIESGKRPACVTEVIGQHYR